jgi:hypothetical protein
MPDYDLGVARVLYMPYGDGLVILIVPKESGARQPIRFENQTASRKPTTARTSAIMLVKRKFLFCQYRLYLLIAHDKIMAVL